MNLFPFARLLRMVSPEFNRHVDIKTCRDIFEKSARVIFEDIAIRREKKHLNRGDLQAAAAYLMVVENKKAARLTLCLFLISLIIAVAALVTSVITIRSSSQWQKDQIPLLQNIADKQ